VKLRYSTRDLLWLTLVVALGLGWFIDHKKHDYPFYGIGSRSDVGLSASIVIYDRQWNQPRYRIVETPNTQQIYRSSNQGWRLEMPPTR
jgi:hypothetical protein